MVMDASSNVQCLGREFVRQYYTLLHEAPAHLHRFYSNESCFVHGGLDTQNRETKPVFGQKEIHERIQQLKFRDCHARIAQVDSHATHADGVVVQVTGELSNNGQPMRRFMQTFVLAPQSPKRYYVHNDIFRYQDDIIDDEEPEQESDHRESEEEVETDPRAPLESVEQVADDYYNTQVPTVNGSAHVDEVPTPVSPPAAEEIRPEPPQAIPPTVAAPVTPAPVTLTPVTPPPVPAPTIPPVSVPEQKESPQLLATPEEPKSVEMFEEQVHPAQVPETTASSEPKTYAHLVKLGASASNSFSSAVSSSVSPTSSKQTTSPSSDQTSRPESNKDLPSLNMVSQPQRSSRPRGSSRGSGTGRGEQQWFGGRSSGDDSGSISGGDGDRRRGGSNGQGYPDSHQLFLGNLPHALTEDDLKEVFSEFGTIVDLRIHSKSNAKGGSGIKVPNYGFLIYETPESVQTALNSKPIRWPQPHGNIFLNVEEKKTRSRQDGGRMGGGDMGRSGGGSGRGGSSMRGSGGMGGAPRGARGGMSSYSNRGEGRGGSIGRSYRPR